MNKWMAKIAMMSEAYKSGYPSSTYFYRYLFEIICIHCINLACRVVVDKSNMSNDRIVFIYSGHLNKSTFWIALPYDCTVLGDPPRLYGGCYIKVKALAVISNKVCQYLLRFFLKRASSKIVHGAIKVSWLFIWKIINLHSRVRKRQAF